MDFNIVRELGNLRMYKTSYDRYSIYDLDECLVSNQNADAAYSLWDVFVKEYEKDYDESATRLSLPLESDESEIPVAPAGIENIVSPTPVANLVLDNS